MATLKEMLVALGSYKVVDPVIDLAYDVVERNNWYHQSRDSPHGRPWHTSFHASSFPGDSLQACGRAAVYGLMDAQLGGGPMDRWLSRVVEAGKEMELRIVRKMRDAGYLVRSADVTRSTDPDAHLPQIGFVDREHWLTGSIDMPILPPSYSSPHIVEVKSKHETKVDEMMAGMRKFDPGHRSQLLCSLGLANENPQIFVHPTEDRLLDPPFDGSIYYEARDDEWPGPVKNFEFYFEHNPGFMEQGRARLSSWRQSFLDQEIPQTVQRKNTRSHPYGWKWSEGVCKFCPLKKACKSDYEKGITKLSDSHAVAAAKFSRPDYDPKEKRRLVLDAWDLSD